MAPCGVAKARNWLMSVPEAKALSPAPVRISTLMARLQSASWQISARRSYISKVNALRACGRLKVTRPTPSRMSKRMSSCSVIVYLLGRLSLTMPRRRSRQCQRRQAGKIGHDLHRHELRVLVRQVGAVDPHAAESERGCPHHVPAVRRNERDLGRCDAEPIRHHRVDGRLRLVDADRVDREHRVE